MNSELIAKIGIYTIAIGIISIFFGGVLYSVDKLSEVAESAQLKEMLFWSALILLFIGQVQKGLEGIFTKGVDSK